MKHLDENNQNENQVSEAEFVYNSSREENVYVGISSPIPQGCISFEEFADIFAQKLNDCYANL